MSRFGIPAGALHLNTLNGILPILSAQHISPFVPPVAPPSAPTGLSLSFTGPIKGKYTITGNWSYVSGATSYTYSLQNISSSVVYASNITTNFTTTGGYQQVIVISDSIQLSVSASNSGGTSATTIYVGTALPP